MNAEWPSLVGGGADDATVAGATDDDGPAAQSFMVALLHACVIRIHIDVQDGRRTCRHTPPGENERAEMKIPLSIH
jgi:hypothetical protein